VAATYCIVLTLMSCSLTSQVSALAHRAAPATTGHHVTAPWTEPRYSQQYMPFVGCGRTADKRKKVDCSMECTSKLIYMRDMNVRVST
jgi:hypothetical protein